MVFALDIIDIIDKTVMFFDKSVRLYDGIKIYNEDEKMGGGGGEYENVLFVVPAPKK